LRAFGVSTSLSICKVVVVLLNEVATASLYRHRICFAKTFALLRVQKLVGHL
jgi:hypothetical protein